MASDEPYYDAFVSYSHAQDSLLARALQSELERFARPWYRPRAMRVFRDATNLSASPGLWQSIERALETSHWLILIASPASARSEWVRQEVRWWLAHRDADRILIALTDGEIHWTGADFDWARTSALPTELSGEFRAEPFWIDLRKLRPDSSLDTDSAPQLGDLVAEFAAPIHGRDKDTLVGEHVRYQRRTRRLVRAVVASLSVLLLAVSGAAYVANNQRGHAVTQARIASARQLAAESEALLNTNLDVAQLLAVKAYQTDRDPQTLSALFRAVTSSPALVRYMPTGDQITAIAGSADGRVAFAGTSGGSVFRWDLATGTRQRVALLHQSISALASNKDGTVIAASTPFKVVIWVSGQGIRMLSDPSDGADTSVAVSPTGRYVAFGVPSKLVDASGVPTGSVALIDRFTGRTERVKLAYPASFLAMPTDAALTAIEGSGTWERFKLPGLSPTLDSAYAVEGVHVLAQAMSGNGAFFAYSNGGSDLFLFSTAHRQVDPATPADLLALSHGSDPEALAVSADGRRVAVADAGTIYVGATGKTAPGSAQQLVLSGNSSTSAVVFLGDDSHLLSASGDSLVLWDSDQLTRIGSQASMSVPFACSACPPPAIEVRPDGLVAAVLGDISPVAPALALQVTIHGLEAGRGQTVINSNQYGVLGWSPGSSRLYLATLDGGVQVRSTAHGIGAPVIGQWPPFARDQIPIALSAGGRQIVTLGSTGRVQVFDTTTRRLERTIPGQAKPDEDLQASASAAGSFVAEAVYRSDDSSFLRVIATETGAVRTVGTGDVDIAAFTGRHLVVLRESGQLEVWNQGGTVLQQSIDEDQSYVRSASGVLTAPVIAGSLLIQQRSDGSVSLIDLRTGNEVGSLGLPSGSTGFKTGFAATPDGQRLIGATETRDTNADHGQILQWSLSPHAWMRVACSSSGRDLTAAQWRRFVGTAPGDLACS